MCRSFRFVLLWLPNTAQGYTLVEVSIVMTIICILALSSVYMYINPTAKVKSVIFCILTDLNLARSEAVNQNRDVLVDFTLGAKDGYIICLDTDSDKDCNDEAVDNIIREVLFRAEVQYYDCTSAPPYPVNGPSQTPAGTKLAGKNGLIFGGPNYIKWQPDGTSSDNGSIIVYHPAPQNPQKVKGDTYAAVISSAATGKIRIMRWRQEGGWSMR